MDLNRLKTLMDFYQSQFTPHSPPSGDLWGGALLHAADANNERGAAMNWAEKMMQQDEQGASQQHQAPNFFQGGGQSGVQGPGSQPPPTFFASGEGLDRYAPTPYTPPERFQPGRQRRYGPDYLQEAFMGPSGSTGNYLSQLLKMGPR